MDGERVEMCAKAAYVYKDIMDMPMGFQSLIGDMGSILSGGQKQRVLLARALYHNPKILFLDEGTANLDPQTERSVLNLLTRLPVTQITVAHRAAAIENCNRIFHVENGKVQEIDKASNTAPQGNIKQGDQQTIDAVWKDGKFLAG